MRVLLRDLNSNKKINLDSISQSYIDFMTTPGSHNDVYASSSHRLFFQNLVINNLPPSECPDNDAHNVDSIDGLINCIPIILAGILNEKNIQIVTQEAIDVMMR